MDSQKSKGEEKRKTGSSGKGVSRSRKKTSAPVMVVQGETPSDPSDLHARIADRAYELYVHRGGHHGRDVDDWLEAERQVLNEGC